MTIAVMKFTLSVGTASPCVLDWIPFSRLNPSVFNQVSQGFFLVVSACDMIISPLNSLQFDTAAHKKRPGLPLVKTPAETHTLQAFLPTERNGPLSARVLCARGGGGGGRESYLGAEASGKYSRIPLRAEASAALMTQCKCFP